MRVPGAAREIRRGWDVLSEPYRLQGVAFLPFVVDYRIMPSCCTLRPRQFPQLLALNGAVSDFRRFTHYASHSAPLGADAVVAQLEGLLTVTIQPAELPRSVSRLRGHHHVRNFASPSAARSAAAIVPGTVRHFRSSARG